MSNRVKRVTRKESLNARMEFVEIMKHLHFGLKNEYKFCVRINGSARYNCIVTDTNGQYDLDYRMILTCNCKSDCYPSNPKCIKNEIFKTLQDINEKQLNDSYSLEQSKSVITMIKKVKNERTWSYDICIVKEFSEDEDAIFEYIGRNSQGNDVDGGNAYTWCLLGKYNKAYDKFKSLTHYEKSDIIENCILPKKIKNMELPKNDSRKITSEEIFINCVNNYELK